jgi:hypothetical protein
MKFTDSNKIYFKIIAGILVISVLAIFLGFTLGVGGNNTSENSEILFIPENKTLKNNVLGKNDVSVPYECYKSGLDTETGWIRVCDYYFDNDILPLCISDCSIDDWYMIFCSWGGYVPTDGSVVIYQPDPDDKNKLVEKGTLDIDFVEIPMPTDCCCANLIPCCCEPTVWKAIFSVECGGCIALDSNHIPTFIDETCVGGGPGTDFNCWEVPAQPEDPPRTLGKEVTLEFFMDWQGCNGPDQQFEVILIHKVMFPESSTPE